MVWCPGETFEGFAFLCDDRGTGADSLSVTAYRDGYSLLPDADNAPLSLPVSCHGNRISFPVPAGESFTVVCEAVKDGEAHRVAYLFLVGEEGSLSRGPILRFVREYRLTSCK